MSLQMIQKPPVIFKQYDPSRILGKSDLISATGFRENEAISRLWLNYGRKVMADSDPCLEANEGAAETIALTSCYTSLSKMNVHKMQGENYELRTENSCLYLSETDEGDIYLYFLSPEKYYNRREECRIDLTDFGSDTAAYFIATMFDSYGYIEELYDKNDYI